MPWARRAVAVNGGTLDLAGYSVTCPTSAVAPELSQTVHRQCNLNVNQIANTTFGGAVTDGAFHKTAVVLTGSANLTVTGVNTYSGTTTINSSLPDPAYPGENPTLTLWGQLTNSPVAIQSGALLLAGTIGQSVTMSGGAVDEPASGVTPLIAGNLTVTGGTANWYAAQTTIAQGVTVQGGQFNVGAGSA